MGFKIHEADWSTHEADLLAVRVAVFVEEQGVPLALEHDEHDAGALHVMAISDRGSLIGTARMLDNGHIGRMAVLRDQRGRGVGTALLQRLLRIAAGRKQRSVFLHAQCSAIPFYERLGFVAEGRVFLDAGIEHRAMVHALTGGQDWPG
jgi:predicted GNAT family N-acyltransferase